MAINTGPNDAVFVPAFTFVATAEAPAFLGATVFFLDVDKESYNLDPKYFEAAILEAKQKGLNPPKRLFLWIYSVCLPIMRQSCRLRKSMMFLCFPIARKVLARLPAIDMRVRLAMRRQPVFFPAKPLGCYGDGGAVFCHSEDFYQKLFIASCPWRNQTLSLGKNRHDGAS